jgi:phenylalanyl-tRNA synthetase alpha chain
MAEAIELARILDEIENVHDLRQLDAVRHQWVGRKGWLTEQMKALSQLPPEERRQRGQMLNQWRAAILEKLETKEAWLNELAERERLVEETLDMSWPGRVPEVGLLHPMTRVRRRIEDVLMRMGFSLAYGPQVETEWYNFEALNILPDHPARDMQDSFFVDIPHLVLRTHTSPVQIRSMQAHQGRLPVKIAAPGFTYRRDDDATHVPMFQQVEGLLIDRGIGLADLKGTLNLLAGALFGESIGTRFRSSYFPFTEPSVEMDVTCAVCGGDGCRVCKETGWVEILGAGVVHPQVLKNGGYDPAQVSGFAFGLGIERVTMRIFGVDDLRLLYQNDLRYLAQFVSGGGSDLP